MTSSPVSHALVTQGMLYNIAGSETVSFEVAQYFAQQGARVTVAAHGFNDRWAEQFALLDDTVLLRIDDPALASRLEASPPDLVWAHHGVLPEAVLRSRDTTVIFNQMSGAHPLEYPSSTAVVRGLGSLLSFNAPEILEVQKATGILDGIPDERLAIFGNPAPDAFLVETPTERLTLQKLLVVSNHLPPEVLEAIQVLRERHSIKVDVLGLNGDHARPERVVPATLETVDAVLTIGKTVQYAVAAGVPVYCYDQFGGPGWLDADNFDRAAHHNFAGRGFGSKSATLIVTEITELFDSASETAVQLHSAHGSRLVMGTVMPRLIDEARRLGRPEGELPEHIIQGHLKAQAALGEYVRIAAHNEVLRAAAEAEAKRTRQYFSEVESTRSYRTARSVSEFTARVKVLGRRP